MTLGLSGPRESFHAFRQNHCSRYYGPKQGTAPHFVNTRNQTEAVVPQRLFRRIAAHQLLQHLLFRRGSGDGSNGARIGNCGGHAR